MCAPPLAHLYGIQSFLRIPVEDFRRMSADILARTYMFSRSVRRSPLFRDIRVYTRRMCTHARGAGARYIRAPGDSTKAIPKSIGIKICDARARACVHVRVRPPRGKLYSGRQSSYVRNKTARCAAHACKSDCPRRRRDFSLSLALSPWVRPLF